MFKFNSQFSTLFGLAHFLLVTSFSQVAKLAEAARLRDAADGHEIAKELEGKVTRKVVKQTVMTIVYGVTFVGGRLQIERQLKDLEMNDKLIFKASTYLVTKVFNSIGEMFTAARAIQVNSS